MVDNYERRLQKFVAAWQQEAIDLRNLPCPCTSRSEGAKKAKHCCQRPDGSFRPKTVTGLPNHSSRRFFQGEGRVNDGCYASALGDCDLNLSREHYLSKGILKTFGDIRIQGPHWARAPRLVGINSLTAKMLCTRHNNLLSRMDSEATRLYKLLYRIGNQDSSSVNYVPKQVHLVSGDLLERWVLKFTAGIIAGGIEPLSGGLSKDHWKPSLDMLQHIFEDGEQTGAFQLQVLTDPRRETLPISCQMNSDSSGNIWESTEIYLHGIRLRICNPDLPTAVTPIMRHTHTRPNMLVFSGKTARHDIHISWKQSGFRRAVLFSEQPAGEVGSSNTL